MTDVPGLYLCAQTLRRILGAVPPGLVAAGVPVGEPVPLKSLEEAALTRARAQAATSTEAARRLGVHRVRLAMRVARA